MAASGGHWKAGKFTTRMGRNSDPLYLEAINQNRFIEENRLGGIPLYRQVRGIAKQMSEGGVMADLVKNTPRLRRSEASVIAMSRRKLRHYGYGN